MNVKFPVRKLVRYSVFSAAVLALLCSMGVAAGVVDFSPGLLRYVTKKWGSSGAERLSAWRATELDYLRKHQKIPDTASVNELQGLNLFWNKVPYYSDQEHWGMPDYWASPVEMSASNGGDCEDYSIAKYFSLRELGIPVQNIRITYVRAVTQGHIVAHMVLAYYPTPDADPYILDNLSDKLQLASERTDLDPVYSFNDEDLWASGANSSKGKSSQIRLWRELLDKMEKERRM